MPSLGEVRGLVPNLECRPLILKDGEARRAVPGRAVERRHQLVGRVDIAEDAALDGVCVVPREIGVVREEARQRVCVVYRRVDLARRLIDIDVCRSEDRIRDQQWLEVVGTMPP